MKRIGRISIALSIISVVSIGLALGLFFPWKNLSASGQNESMSNENVNEERSYDLSNIKELSFNVSSAAIEIKQSKNKRLRIYLHGSVSGLKPVIESVKTGNNLTINVKRKSGFSFFSSSNLKLDIEIPAGYNHVLSVRNSSGKISIAELTLEELHIGISSGSVSIDRLKTENFTYDSSSGSLKADYIESIESRLKASSGSITLSEFSGNLEVKMSSGNLKVAYNHFANEVSVNNSSGNIAISLPPDANFILDAHTSSGKVSCEYPITIGETQKSGRLKGAVGSGENEIVVKTSSGNISILKN